MREGAQKVATFPSSSLLQGFAKQVVARERRKERPVDKV